MKIRIAENTLRFRLRKSDLEQLKIGPLEEAVPFPPDQKLVFRIAIGEVEHLQTHLANQVITITLPVAQAAAWMESDQVGIDQIAGAEPNALRILIEKDFPCDHRKTENKQDTFYELAAKKAKPES